MDNFNIKKFFKNQYLAEAEATDAEEKEFHTKLDTLVHNTFGKSPEEMEESKVAEYHSYLMKIGGKELAGTEEEHLTDVKNLGGDFDKYLQNEIDYFDISDDEEMVTAIERFRKGDMKENDDVQVDVNAKSRVQSKGGAEKKQARKGYGDKPNKSGRGKEVKRKMNKRNRKDAKQALKDA